MRRRRKIIYGEFACTNAMDAALHGPFRFECGRDVERVRQCCYRIRMRRRARGDTRYDGLKFRINGSELAIYNLGPRIDITAEEIVEGVIERMERDRKHDAG